MKAMSFKEFCIKYLKLLGALFLTAVAYNLFLYPTDIVAGGPGGLGILFEYICGIDRAIVVFVISFALFLFSIFFMEIEQVISAFFVSIFFPLFIEITESITDLIIIDTNQVLVLVLFGAIITGIAQGFVFKEELNIGGFSILAKAINKKFHLSVPHVNAVLNAIVIVFGAIFISIDTALYALLFVVILKIVSERVMLGTSSNKTFKIISDKYEDIQKFIHESLGHDVTLYDTIGKYDDEKRKLLMSVIPTSEFIVLKDYVKSVDKNAFLFITDSYDTEKQDVTIRKAGM